MNLDPNSIYEKLVNLGDAWAEAKEVADHLDETRKTLLSQLGTEIDGSEKAKESHALRHPTYQQHIKAMVAAKKAENKAKVRYDSAKTWAELCRTVAANERAALRNAP